MLKNAKLCLGTVQLGLNYGISNKLGKPSKEKAFDILDAAIEQGITCFDTAAAYGDAEQRLGEYISLRKQNGKIKIITKSKPNLVSNTNHIDRKAIRFEMEESLKRLKVDVLDGYLLHNADDFYNQDIIDGLFECKRSGLVKNIGVSIYEEKHAVDAVKSGKIDYIQVPYNVFDRRLDACGFFNMAKQNNVTVFTRSMLLQGLILMNEEEIPDNLNSVIKYLRIFDEIIGKYGFNRLEASFLFCYMNTDIDFIVFGVDSVGQLSSNIRIIEKNENFDGCLKKLKENFLNIDKRIISPNLWHENEYINMK